MTATLEDLTALFVRLAETPSPSGRERAVADLIVAEVRAAGLDVQEDDSAPRTGAAAGNLIVRVPGRGAGTPIALCAHMDTVPVEVVITASEEVGLRGAKELDLGALGAKAAFIFDSEGPVGTVILSAPSLSKFTAEFRGRAAHAGIEPEKGRSAIVAAARAVAAMPTGRIDAETTANVGVVSGGSATNVVPERCRLECEARSRDGDKLTAQLERMIEAVNVAAAESGVDATITIEEDFAGFDLGQRDLPVRLAAAALADVGLEPAFIGTGGGADANVFNARGLPAVNLGVGLENIHSAQESIALARLGQLYELAHAIVRAAGAAEA